MERRDKKVRLVPLSDRERQLFVLVGEGRSTVEVAKILGISPATARAHLINICEKLSVSNQDELVIPTAEIHSASEDATECAGLLLGSKADKPPVMAEFILLMIPERNRAHLIGDLEEEYRTIVLPEYGRFKARLWYWEQTAIAVGCYVWPLLRRVLGLAAIWKVMGG